MTVPGIHDILTRLHRIEHRLGEIERKLALLEYKEKNVVVTYSDVKRAIAIWFASSLGIGIIVAGVTQLMDLLKGA